MHGLNPYALPHTPKHQLDMNEIKGQRKENIMKSPLHTERQGEDLTKTKTRKKKSFNQGWKNAGMQKEKIIKRMIITQ